MTRLDRELERVLDPAYLSGLADRSLDDIRAMRAECQAAETAVSFLRRLAQGRLDIIHACLDRREAGASAQDLTALVDELPTIIGAGPPRPAGPGRLPVRMAPEMEDEELASELDEVLDAGRIGELPTMAEAELRDVAEQLAAMETLISHRRRALHEQIDRLQAEIVNRYKSGEASVDGLLA